MIPLTTLPTPSSFLTEGVIIALITAIVGPIMIFLIKYLIKPRPVPPKKRPEDLKSHIFFSEISYMIQVTTQNIHYPKDPVRSAMVRLFIRIKLKSIERHFKQLVDDVVVGKEISSCVFNNTITKAVVDYEAEAKERFIPEVFISKFSTWHTPKIKEMRDMIEYISRSTIYDNNIEKTCAVLDVILMVLHLTLMDAETTLYAMNGELNKDLEKKTPKDFQ